MQKVSSSLSNEFYFVLKRIPVHFNKTQFLDNTLPTNRPIIKLDRKHILSKGGLTWPAEILLKMYEVTTVTLELMPPT